MLIKFNSFKSLTIVSISRKICLNEGKYIKICYKIRKLTYKGTLVSEIDTLLSDFKLFKFELGKIKKLQI